jgi:RNA polymerase sigma factor (sigma-70 family)
LVLQKGVYSGNVLLKEASLVPELELIQAAQAGCRKSADQLIRMHKGFLHTMARKYRIPGYEYDDLLQLARIGLLEGIRDFNPAAGRKLLTIAVYKIQKQFNIILTAFRQKKRSGTTIPLDSPIPDTEFILSDVVSAPVEATEQDYMPVLMECIGTVKRKKDRAILETIAECVFIGETVTLAALGERFGLHRERVRQLKEKAVSGPAFKRLREGLRMD